MRVLASTDTQAHTKWWNERTLVIVKYARPIVKVLMIKTTIKNVSVQLVRLSLRNELRHALIN